MIKIEKQSSNYSIHYEGENYDGNGVLTINENGDNNFNLSIYNGANYIGNISYNYSNNNENYTFNCSRQYTVEFSNIMNEIINEYENRVE